MASSSGHYLNSGNGPTLQPIDIGHPVYVGLIDPDTAFWSLVKKERLADALADSSLLREYRDKRTLLSTEMKSLRFGLKPSAVYFNPTDRCNLNCRYCYIPERVRKNGVHMSEKQMFDALDILKAYFGTTLPKEILHQVVFHGAEPMLNRKAIFAGIERYKNDFSFGVQTNGALMDAEAIDFLTSHQVGIGLSLDGHAEEVANRTRKTWSGDGVFKKVVDTLERLKGYPGYNVICTVTRENMHSLSRIVDFFHSLEVPFCMLNPVRCTLPGAHEIKPQDHELTEYYLLALDRTYELYEKTGRKLVVANFANVLVGIVAPTARRLMCDISPCGGGRCFFALSATGDLFPCSEFIGFPEFCGGNLFKGEIEKAFKSPAFQKVTERRAEDIEPCSRCAARHFCGSPCPAEAYTMKGGMNQPGAFCELYEEQVRYAFRQIADGKEEAYLWDDWDAGASKTLDIASL